MRTYELEGFFKEFDAVLENKDRYNIEWAFKDAQEKLDRLKEDVIDRKLKHECYLCMNQKRINKKFDLLEHESSSILKKQRWYSRLFSNMLAILTILEFVASIILVMAVSEISHSGASWTESQLLGLWIIITFAFIKVFLEKYMLRPRIEHLGWNLYERSIVSLRKIVVEFNKFTNSGMKIDEYEERLETA